MRWSACESSRSITEQSRSRTPRSTSTNCSSSDLSNADDIRPDYLVHTVGFLLAEGPKFVSLAQEVLPDGDGFRAVTHIPLSIVERIVRLGPDTNEASALA